MDIGGTGIGGPGLSAPWLPDGGIGGFGLASVSPSFWLPLNDLGNGAVNLVPGIHAGSGVASFTRATTATTVDRNGLLISVAAGVARSYYDPATGAYLGYLAEGARTNLCLQSENFTIGSQWTNSSGSITVVTDTDIAPDGTLTADTLTDESAAAVNGARQTFTVADDALTHVFSVFIKKTVGAVNFAGFQIRYTGGTPLDARAVFNTNTGEFTTNSGAPILSVFSFPEYWRVTVAKANNATGNTSFDCSVVPAWNDTGTITPAASAVGSKVVWGAQLEKASFSSSYIPTTTIAVARNADVLTYTGSENARNEEGSVYAEYMLFAPANSSGVNHHPIGATTAALIYLNSATARTTINNFDGTNAIGLTGLSNVSVAIRKRAASWGPAGQFLSGDGIVSSAGTFSGSMGTIATIFAVGNAVNGLAGLFGFIRNVSIWGSQLPDIFLQDITR